ncbi:MAG: DUF427 domain-containing protein [Gemmatimonadota bacterium]|nr:DUF427 domain-containing protein [Gemmatimonadota bacterium]
MTTRGPFGWRYFGQERPPFAEDPGPGQESVWDYPRPPRLEPDDREVIVSTGEVEIARTQRAVRVLETASPPAFYLPPEDVRMDLLIERPGRSACEWKGTARYWSVRTGERVLEDIAWSYPDPRPDFASLRDYVSFYPGRVACRVGGERVEPQPGGFYGGWVTSEIVGPVKGAPGTGGW